ncbi:hypothetical protein ACIRSS_21515 [Amycolatopsis sp. NPDC101161]|uniref:hypothetical protein n=1 Tax=Amycolatopsis sp. NPDC101161 TaxID=3363940 RepID=UPI00381286FE
MFSVDLRGAEEGGLGDVRAFVKAPEEGLKPRGILMEVDAPRDGPDVRRQLVEPGNERAGLRSEVEEFRATKPKSPIERPNHLVARVGVHGKGAVIGHTGMELVPEGERLAADLFVPPLAGFRALPPGVHEGVLNPPDPGGGIGVEAGIVEVGLVGGLSRLSVLVVDVLVLGCMLLVGVVLSARLLRRAAVFASLLGR